MTTNRIFNGFLPISGCGLAIFLFSINICAAEPVFEVQNDMVVAEAEDLQYSSNWALRTSPSGYKGRGFLVWNGGCQSCACLGKPEGGNHSDITGECQGSDADWLRVTVNITVAGLYVVDLLNIHFMEDGDNDIWIHMVDKAPAIVRVGSHHPGQFGWLNWGPSTVGDGFAIRTPGVYTFYVAGRSQGFGVDRIYIARKLGPSSYPAGMWNTEYAASVPQQNGTALLGPVKASAVSQVAAQTRIFDLSGRSVANRTEPGHALRGVYVMGRSRIWCQ